MRLGAAAALLIVVLGGGAVAETLPFEGKWALAVDKCSVVASPTEPGQPITLTARRLVAAPFMTCDFTSVLPGGISFRIDAACEASGRHGSEFFTFAVLGGRLYWSWAGKTQSFERCPGS